MQKKLAWTRGLCIVVLETIAKANRKLIVAVEKRDPDSQTLVNNYSTMKDFEFYAVVQESGGLYRDSDSYSDFDHEQEQDVSNQDAMAGEIHERLEEEVSKVG
jgi:hypothetical protein